ncbi:acyl carrier protein [Hymenobacter sp. BT178]|uniref:Acyl carrier protein n=2 Tax=Hymenobacter lucidus TaxID=2880930 RepID=A0ABS8AZ43_9BACT|nr:acyl carrier protein [Hymenobacter lucidus]MCB2411079.1 acyl carrier protein [Hymenobacter lucidus]
MRATSWRDTIGQLAVRLLPPDTNEPPPSAGRPDFGLSALDFVELLLQVEQHFNIRFSAEQLEDLRVAQLVLNRAAAPLWRQLYAEFFAQLMQHGDWLD